MAHLSLDRQVIMEDGMLDRSVICKLVIGLSGHHGRYSAWQLVASLWLGYQAIMEEFVLSLNSDLHVYTGFEMTVPLVVKADLKREKILGKGNVDKGKRWALSCDLGWLFRVCFF